MGREKVKQSFDAVLARGEKAFVPYIMAGDGGLDILNERIQFFEENGATALELGIPFSDPVADGPAIQEAGLRALMAGTTLKGVLEELQKMKEKRKIPIILMTYLNPIFVFGIRNFAERCHEAGVDGVIIPDLPIEEEELVTDELTKNQISHIRLAALTSSKERVKEIADKTEGFLYAVTVRGITGARQSYDKEVGAYLEEVKKSSSMPVLAGFGVSTPEQVIELSRYCDGVVVGSKVIELLQNNDLDAIKALMTASKKAGVEAL